MVTRRQLLASAPAMALPLLPFTAHAVAGPPPGGNAVYSYVQANFATLGAKLKRGNLVRSDMQTAINSLSMLTGYLNQIGANSEFQALATYAINGSLAPMSDSSPVASTYSSIISVMPNLSSTSIHSDISQAFQIVVPPGQQLSLLQALQEYGIEYPLQSVRSTLTANLSRLPIVAPANPQIVIAPGGPPGGESFCAWFNWLAGAIGAAAFVLALGCAPEPFFLVICPAVVVIGIIAAIIGLLAWLLC